MACQKYGLSVVFATKKQGILQENALTVFMAND
jgi:hypothetical protein